MMRRIAVLDAPTNLGLRPPTSTSVPGCGKAPGALRDHGLLARLRARDAGCLTPPRYDPGDWRPGDGVCHAREISGYSVALADRIGAIIDRGEFPLVLGGDCSVLLGSALAMHRLGEAVGGRIGLVFVDGHSDFRHPGNASYVGAAAGEDLALVTGRGQADLAAIEGRRPYFRDIDVVVLGIRAQDEYRLDLQAAGITTRPVPALRAEGAARTAQWAHEQLADCAGYWVHIDVDVLDPAVMPAVDAPDPGGIAFAELEILLAGLVDTPHCLGVELTVFDPDYDPEGAYAAEIVNTVVAGLAPVSAPSALPPRLLPADPVAPAARPGNGRGAELPVPRAPETARPGSAGPAEPTGPSGVSSRPVDGSAGPSGVSSRPDDGSTGSAPVGVGSLIGPVALSAPVGAGVPIGPGSAAAADDSRAGDVDGAGDGGPADATTPVAALPDPSAPGRLRRVPVAEEALPAEAVPGRLRRVVDDGPRHPGTDIA
ncbi:arginase [Micromonospora auratinigra]|uniref:Arginase n=1 Tax=Micromonospora auratinigra TaxID=261654 RepID=A0A1A8ZR47_9ACTN|nr:arginase [Micromonospora auratinigra]